MLSKIVLGCLVAIVAGMLAWGIYAYCYGSGYGQHGRYAASAYRGDGRGEGQGQGRGYQNYEQNDSHLSQDRVEEWLTVSGEITALDQAGVTLKTDDGQTMLINLGPSWFWESRGQFLEVGQQVTVRYFSDDGHLKAGEVTVDSTGERLVLREEDGQPVWAGRGQGRDR